MSGPSPVCTEYEYSYNMVKTVVNKKKTNAEFGASKLHGKP